MPYIPSPCINQCQLDDNKVCSGCQRTLEEISVWSKSNNQQKQAILDRLASLNHSDTGNRTTEQQQD